MPDPGTRSAPQGRGGVTLAVRAEGHVLQLLARAGAPAPAIAGLRPAGPGQWFLVGDGPLAPEALAADLPDVAVCDQSHGRVRIAVQGPDAQELLARGTGLDLAGFEHGRSAATLLGPIGVHLTRTGEEAFELLVLRSFAEALMHDLQAMAAEYEG